MKDSERRKTHRRPIVESFSLFVVLPQKGPYRLPIHDISEEGLGFDADMEGEPRSEFTIEQSERLQLHFYLNQTLHVPLTVRVARLERVRGIRRIGAEVMDRDSAAGKAFTAFVELLDKLAASKS